MAYQNISIPAGSSNVQAVAYDPALGKLLITFNSNAQYVYDGVPGTVADGFTTSGMSAGKYLLLAIKNQYPYQRIA